MNLRKAARGQPCLIRLPCCSGDPETTVLCHYRLAGFSGMGMKSPDEFGAFGCDRCHAVVDGRAKLEGWTRAEIRLAHAEAVMRTQELLRRKVA